MAGQVICGGVQVAIYVIDTISTMKANSEVRTQYQNQFSILELVLEKIRRRLTDHSELQNNRDIIGTLQNLKQTIDNAKRKCSELNPSNIMEYGRNFIRAGSQSTTLEHLHRDFMQAIEIANLTMQLINQQCQEADCSNITREFERLHEAAIPPSEGVFEQGEPPAAVTNVSATPHGNLLTVRWNDEANRNKQINKYQIKLCNPDVPVRVERNCNTWSARVEINIAERLMPWREYNIQVRAVNNFGYGPWSEPECEILMNQSPPIKPKVRLKSAPISTSLQLQVDRPELYHLQQITHCIIRKRIVNTFTGWETEQVPCNFIEDSTVQTISGHNFQTRSSYRIQIRLCNEWGESEPSEEIVTNPIANMLPRPPRRLFFVKESRSHNKVWLTWKPPRVNQGCIDHYVVEKRTRRSAWEEVHDSMNTYQVQRVLTFGEETIQTMAFTSRRTGIPVLTQTLQSLRERERQNESFFKIVDNLQQNTTYIFRVYAVNLNGEKGLPSDELELETRIHPLGRIAIVAALSPVMNIAATLYLVSEDKYENLQEPPDSDN